ncbi:MAG: hypothetical protein KAI64_05825 [Thermoplasmata archaeon]|nr:hypothetical protein [Thermoplasmata archaeon]
MKLFLKLSFSSDGTSPIEVVKSMEDIGFSPVFGDYDFVIDFENPEEFGEIVTKLHETLKGTKVHYSLSTK